MDARHQQQQQQQQQQQTERVPQWSHAETAELLSIRSDLDQEFMETKRNKPLWETVSHRMRLRGFPRSADQCKSKWKNLLTRFKGSEAMEAETSRQFPFQEDLQRIFTDRTARLLHVDKSRGKQAVQVQFQEQEESSDEDDDDERGEKAKKKKKVEKKPKDVDEVARALKEILRRQLEMEEMWMKEVEKREEERKAWEEEWRRSMERLAKERMEMERRWREVEEERRVREEVRAERRHALVMAILAKLAEKGF